MPEQRTLGKYELLDEIGRGGFATVYKARDTRLNRVVALKVLREDYAKRPDVVRRFLDEASRAASLSHPGIVHINEIDEHNNQPFIAMDYLPGGTLAQRLHGEPMPLDAAMIILGQLADALDYAHKRHLVHRDIKPANILFGEEDQVVLVDFGLVKSLIDSGYTIEGTSLGTPHYMAPEQVQGSAADARTDIYALGVVVYEMLSGHVPFQADTPLAVLEAQRIKSPPDLRQANASLSVPVCAAVLKALAKTPEERYDSTRAFVAAVRAAYEESQQQAQQQSERTQLIEQIQTARQAGNWQAVIKLCSQMMRLDPAHPELPAWLNEATKEFQRGQEEELARRRRARRYEEGEAALTAGQWAIAIESFEEVAQGNPDFREVQQKLAQARDELQRAQLYDEAIAHADAQRWADASRIWIKVLQRRMDYHDGDAAARLLTSTEGLLAQLDEATGTVKDLQAALRLFDQLASAREQNDWPTVIVLAEQLLKATAHVQQPAAWLSTARRELELAEARAQAPAVQLPFLQSVAALLSVDRVKWLADGKAMVRVPAGEFLYGDKKEKADLPEYWIDRTPVTNAEYARFVVATKYTAPEHWKGQLPPKNIIDHPVINVSWNDAVAYATWAGKRLPTEQEWEKAARGTDGRKYPWGDQAPTDKLCNFNQNNKSTTPVGRYSPQGDSPYGCVDMAGNVWEWTASDYDNSRKVLRGGSWYSDEGDMHTAYRNYVLTPDGRVVLVGFRCVAEGSGE